LHRLAFSFYAAVRKEWTSAGVFYYNTTFAMNEKVREKRRDLVRVIVEELLGC
jgi:hypothetical protein